MSKVRDLLRAAGRELVTISPDETVAEAARRLVSEDVSSLVVCDGERLVGIFTKNDLTRCCATRPERVAETKVSEYMKTGIFTAKADADLDELVATMVREGFHHVPVRDGEPAIGVVTAMDILAHECRRLHGEGEELIRYIRGSY